MRIFYIQETDYIDKGPHQQHHLLENLKLRGHEVLIMDYEVEYKSRQRLGIFSNKIKYLTRSKIFPKIKIPIIRPSASRVPILNYLHISVTYTIDIIKIIKSYKPDVIMVMGLLTPFITLLINKLYKIPIIYNSTDKFHDAIPIKFLKPFGYTLEKYISRNSDIDLLMNEAMRTYRVNMGTPNKQTVVLRAGVLMDLFSIDIIERNKYRDKFKIKKSDRLLLFMGWLYKFSGLVEVINEMANSTENNVKLCIIGRGDIESQINELTNLPSLKEKIIFIPWVDYLKLPSYLSMADICILPANVNKTMTDIVPIKMYEYLSMGKMVIATKLNGVYEEFGHNGVLYIDKPEDILIKASSLTNEEIHHIGSLGKQFILKNCNWDNIVDTFEQLLVNLSSNKIIPI